MADLDIKTDAQIERELDNMHESLWGKNPSMNPLCLSNAQLEIMEDAGWTRPARIDPDIMFLRRLKARKWIAKGIRNVAEEIMSGVYDKTIEDEMLEAYQIGRAEAAGEIAGLKERLKDALKALSVHDVNYDEYEEEI